MTIGLFLSIVFMTVKLFGGVHFGWFYVFLPMIIEFEAYAVLLMITGIAAVADS